ncbi:DUF4385 domain-containing protein [Haloterrigena sp. SYSU A121-1]|uniref:DUF4385 domain-containing protein n=1 Tax=Haloterrigena gelatinilytica TaxID=2741724 RepID=A0A8J8GJ68_9EURY|nr:DUF4385 domain-containing protein [Haloterrigena gelatinilytica]NUB90526.1 DUF4385 domain-containing protein [Haloterrigena gelatinilytica]
MTDESPEYDVDFRDRPEQYEIGRGEQGAFKVEPYKSELLPLWSYRDAGAARESASSIYERYERYRENDDFPGMDMARKYLQMGYTRAMRYAKYPGGRKYEGSGDEREPQRWADREKRAAALVFERYWERVREDDAYQRAKDAHRERR